MDKTYHLISGLPRSGSTLLSAILNQNPRFHANISSPLESYIKNIIPLTHIDPGNRSIVDAVKMKNIIKGLFDGYYKDVDKEVCFNSGRNWTSGYHIINEVYPNAKVICTVRDVAEIMNSFEWLFLKNPFNISYMYGPRSSDGKFNFFNETVEARFMHLLNLVIPPLNSLREMYFGPHRDKMLLIEYKSWLDNPQQTIDQIYDFLQEERFDHDLDNIKFDNIEFDKLINTPGMHRVRNKVSLDKKQMILPPDLIEKCSGLEFWRDFYFTKN